MFPSTMTVAKLMKRAGYLARGVEARHVGGPVYVRPIAYGEAAGSVEVMYSRKAYGCTVVILPADVEADVLAAVQRFVDENRSAA